MYGTPRGYTIAIAARAPSRPWFKVNHLACTVHTMMCGMCGTPRREPDFGHAGERKSEFSTKIEGTVEHHTSLRSLQRRRVWGVGRTKICVYYVRTVRTIGVKPCISICLDPYECFRKPYESRTNGLSDRTKRSYGFNGLILLYLCTSRTKPYEGSYACSVHLTTFHPLRGFARGTRRRDVPVRNPSLALFRTSISLRSA
jgi:hypothetical protein